MTGTPNRDPDDRPRSVAAGNRLAALPPPTGLPVIAGEPVIDLRERRDGAGTPDQAAPGGDGNRRLGPALWAALAVTVVAFGLLAADWAVRTYEMSVLLNRVQASEAAMIATQEQMRALRLPDDPSPAQRQRAAETLQAIAGAGHEAVAVAGQELAGMSFLPWHSALIDAQGGYLAHNRAWVDHLQRGSQDVTVLLSDDAVIEATWTDAERKVRDAMPWPTWASLTDRVERIFTDDAPSEQPEDGGGLPT